MVMRRPHRGQHTCYSFNIPVPLAFPTWLPLSFLLILTALFSPAGPPCAGAQQANQTDTKAGQGLVDSLSFADRDDPIDIRSQSLEFSFEDKRVRYRDKVIATQGDVQLTCNLLTVIYEDPIQRATSTSEQETGSQSRSATTSATSNQRLKEIIAEGNVKVTAENGYATGKKLVFNDNARTVVLSGDAVLHEGSNQVSGDRVIVYLDEKRSLVEGRARMQLLPQPETLKRAASE